MEDFIEYKRAKAIANKTIKEKKKENYLKFISSINKHTNKKFMWNKITPEVAPELIRLLQRHR